MSVLDQLSTDITFAPSIFIFCTFKFCLFISTEPINTSTPNQSLAPTVATDKPCIPAQVSAINFFFHILKANNH